MFFADEKEEKYRESLNYDEKIIESWKYTKVHHYNFVAPPLAFITAWILWGVDLTADKQNSSIRLQLSHIAVARKASSWGIVMDYLL